MSSKQKEHKLSAVSMNGRMAYTIMCVEAFLVAQYPDRDWSLIANKMWLATTMRWLEWTDLYCCYIPDVIFRYKKYNFQDYGDY
nr:hypothetical protein [bacterium]